MSCAGLSVCYAVGACSLAIKALLFYVAAWQWGLASLHCSPQLCSCNSQSTFREWFSQDMTTKAAFDGYLCIYRSVMHVCLCGYVHNQQGGSKGWKSEDGDVSGWVTHPKHRKGVRQAVHQPLLSTESMCRAGAECWCHWCHQAERLQDEAQGICGLLLQHKQEKGLKCHKPRVLWHQVRVQPAAQ